ncbi:MAG: hypothetical protein WBL95_03940 [Microcoleus sp.]
MNYSGFQGSEVHAIKFYSMKRKHPCPMPNAQCPGTPNLPEKG